MTSTFNTDISSSKLLIRCASIQAISQVSCTEESVQRFQFYVTESNLFLQRTAIVK